MVPRRNDNLNFLDAFLVSRCEKQGSVEASQNWPVPRGAGFQSRLPLVTAACYISDRKSTDRSSWKEAIVRRLALTDRKKFRDGTISPIAGKSGSAGEAYGQPSGPEAPIFFRR
jgi:hypothetical protein